VAACRLAAENITDEGLEKLRLTLLRHQDVKPDKISNRAGEWEPSIDRPAVWGYLVSAAPLPIPGGSESRPHPIGLCGSPVNPRSIDSTRSRCL
jgi:hypothetical protein